MANQIFRANDQIAFFLSREVAWHHIFDFVLQEIKRADKMIISSFAITDKQVRRLIRSSHQVDSITLFLDFTIASRNARVTQFAATNVDELYLTNNHSKTIFASNPGNSILAVMSNNATNNQRYESGFIFRNHDLIRDYVEHYEKMKADSVIWRR